MPHPRSLATAARAAGFAVLLPTLGLTGCGERAQRADSAASTQADAGDPDGDGGPARPPIDPCALLTKQEIAEQLLRTLPPSERANWTTTEFQVVPTEVDWGMSRRCEVTWQSQQQISGGTPVTRGLFHLMVFGPDGLGIPESKRRPVMGAGPEIFRHQQVFYVTKGDYAVSLTDFKGTQDADGNVDAGRVALLRAAATRLP